MSYVPQQPWLWNGTIQDNITWESVPNADWYESVVSACALKEDFESFSAGDQTEIGEKVMLHFCCGMRCIQLLLL